jgi:hypothetical protein
VTDILRRVLIDTYAPTADASEFHQIEIRADPDLVYAKLLTADLGGSLIIKTLMGLRMLPSLLLHPTSLKMRLPGLRRRIIAMQTLIGSGFGKLAENPGHELVLGITGRFWRPTGNVLPFNKVDFSGPVPQGLARGVWNFQVKPSGPGRTILSTETRVVCGDPRSRTKFRIYWLVVRPFSGLIRRLMLKSVKRECEASE